MKKSIALVLSLLATSLVLACGGSDDKSPGGASAGTGNSDAGAGNSDAGAGNSNGGNSSGANCSAPEGTSDACFNCVKSSCGSQYSSYCSAKCSTDETSSACVSASTAIGTCAAEHCDTECQGSSGDAGSSGNDTGSGGGGAVTDATCKTLATCCAILPTGEKEGCDHVAGLNYAPSCMSTYSLYKCDAAIAAAGKPKTTACTIGTECVQGPYASDAQASACTQEESGTASDTCPTGNVLGCCTVGGIEEICDYKGHRDPITEADCTSEGGVFSTAP